MAQPVYWIGQDGNIYYGSGQEGAPVQNLGSAQNGQFSAQSDGLYDRFTDNGVPSLTYAATQIQDPAVGTSSTSTTAPSRGGGNADPAPVFNQAAADNTQRTINEIPGLLEAALAAEEARYGNAKRAFDTQETTQRGQYKESSDTNQLNYDANFMDSIRAGIKGLGGLFALLRGTGAAGGTAQDLARDTVAGVTSSDIREGLDTRNENQSGLDSALSTFLTDLRGRREQNEDTRVNNRRSIQANSDTQLQELYGKMAGYYSDVDNQPEYNKWMTMAGNLTPSVAQNSKTQVSNYNTTPISVKAPEITAFKNPAQPSVRVGDSGQIGSGIFTISKPNKKEKERTQVPVTAGA